MNKIPLMNNTKWDELCNTMHSLPFTIFWRTKDINTGYISDWDSDWFYHFKLENNKVTQDAYKSIEWVEIRTDNGREQIIDVIRKIHLPGEIRDNSIIIYGYNTKNKYIGFIG